MDYDLTPYLDEDDNKRINSINNKLDNLMDDLFCGKNLKFIELMKDTQYLGNIKDEYYDLISKEINVLDEASKLLSKSARQEFILSWISILSAYVIPIMTIPSVLAFSNGMKYYTSYQTLKNNEVKNEYLSSFDYIVDRINNYNDVIKSKVGKYINKDKTYLILLNIFMCKNIKFNDETKNKMIDILNSELNMNEDNLDTLLNETRNYIFNVSEKNKTLLLNK